MALKSSIDELIFFIYQTNLRRKYFKKSAESDLLPTSGFDHIVIEYS